MESLSVPMQIEELFSDLPAFAQLAAGLSIEDYQPKLFDFFHYPFGVFWLGVPKAQVNSVREAFAALFLLNLHHNQGWIYNEAQRTNSDQFIIDRLPKEQWKQLLQDKWIIENFNLPLRQLKITPLKIADFSQKFLCWKPEHVNTEGWRNLERVVSSSLWVYSLFSNNYDLYFGQTAEHYFFAESGVYD